MAAAAWKISEVQMIAPVEVLNAPNHVVEVTYKNPLSPMAGAPRM
jgi:hypothetical protein